MSLMGISPDARMEILLKELELLQARFGRYDDLIWRSRSWAVALVSALIGWGLAREVAATGSSLFVVASAVAVLFWLQEGLLRYSYVNKYAARYRRIRTILNDPDADLSTLPVYDLTNHIEGRGKWLPRFLSAFVRIEELMFYTVLAAAPALLCWTLR